MLFSLFLSQKVCQLDYVLAKCLDPVYIVWFLSKKYLFILAEESMFLSLDKRLGVATKMT